MINQKILEAVYLHEPCSYVFLDQYLGYPISLMWKPCTELMMGGLLDWDIESKKFSYKGWS